MTPDVLSTVPSPFPSPLPPAVTPSPSKTSLLSWLSYLHAYVFTNIFSSTSATGRQSGTCSAAVLAACDTPRLLLRLPAALLLVMQPLPAAALAAAATLFLQLEAWQPRTSIVLSLAAALPLQREGVQIYVVCSGDQSFDEDDVLALSMHDKCVAGADQSVCRLCAGAVEARPHAARQVAIHHLAGYAAI